MALVPQEVGENSAGEWAPLKDIIVNIYLDESLETLAKKMKDSHGFDKT